MELGLKQPILIGGLGLTAGAVLLNWVHPGTVHLSDTVTWGMMAMGGLWWLRQRRSSSPLDVKAIAQPLDRTAVEVALTHVERLIQQVQDELPQANGAVEGEQNIALVQPWHDRAAALKSDLDRTALRVAVVGQQSTGKTALTQLLARTWQTTLAEPVELIDGAIAPTPEPDSAADSLMGADLVLFVTNGDLTDSELQMLREFVSCKYRILIAFNKQDHYLPEERPLVLQQVRERVMGLLPIQDVVAVAAAPTAYKVRQHLADGTVQERMEQPNPDIAALTERLTGAVMGDRQRLVLNTVMRQLDGLKADILAELNQRRRDRAMPMIDQAQWIAAAAAFATPIPNLDLLATAAVNAQLVMDLGSLYKQRLSLDHAKTIAASLAEVMIKLELVELSSQAIMPLLKSHALTYVAGGTLQGISAAYLTRIAGLGLVDYFQEQSQTVGEATDAPLNLDRLTHTIKAVFQANQRTAFVQNLVTQGLQRLAPAQKSPLPNVEASA
ncbi:slr1306 family protein [Leptolyngbya sp. AN02str]|uniref:slr1306 family protein n=1 Tax=Leptolyngbya sp. AN02str TaxID=3423363 RepID=UPI003D30FA08